MVNRCWSGCMAAVAVVLLSCSESGDDVAGLQLQYAPVVGAERSDSQKNLSGSASDDGTVYSVNTENADGLWSSYEEIGFYYTTIEADDFILSADVESISGDDELTQGGLMIRSGLSSGNAYAALRLAKGKYDPVERPNSTSSAHSDGEEIDAAFQKGDRISMVCNRTATTGDSARVDVDISVRRGSATVVSKHYSLSVPDGVLYVGIFGADHSAGGTAAFSKLTLTQG